MSTETDKIARVKEYLMSLQDEICDTLENVDGRASFSREEINSDRGGLAKPRVIDDGEYIERGAVQFSHSGGDAQLARRHMR